MKAGQTLNALAAELSRRKDAKKDYIADTRSLAIEADKEGVRLRMNRKTGGNAGNDYFAVEPNAHRQIGDRLGIPAKYYDRMLAESPGLLAENVNHWFQEKPQRRMIRTLDSKARAFLSDRYRCLDDADLAEAVLPILLEDPSTEITSCALTDTKLYIKALFPKIEREIKEGDVVQSGLVISNSEIGAGSLAIQPLVFRLVCANGMIAADHAMKKYHTGRTAKGGEEAYEIFRDETLQADDKALWLKVQDLVRAAMDSAKFEMIVSRLQEATGHKIRQDPVKAIELVQKRYSLTDGERGSVLTHLIEGGDLSQYGLMNAVTRTSQDAPSYERATQLEQLGGQIIDLTADQWRPIAEAA